MTLRAIVDDIVMGAALTYQTAELADRAKFGLPYYLISLSLNILLTLMIVIRLALHIRNTRTALGGNWNRRIVQGRHRHVHRVLCPLWCGLVVVHWTAQRR